MNYDAPPSVAILAVRHLVEMAGEAYAHGVRNAFEVLNGIDYGRDPVSALRAHLAKVPAGQRVAWLIEQIASRKVVRASEDYLVQALIDQSSQAVPAILEAVERLKSVSEVRFASINMLLEALSAIEYSAGRPSVKRLASDSNPLVAETAQDGLKYCLVLRASDW